MEQGKGKIKLSILSFSVLLMGVIGVSGGLAVIGQHFSGVSQTNIQMLISLPCIVVIPVTLLMGKLQEFISNKMLVVIGILFFLIGGVIPAFTTSFTVILILRGIFGIGIGMLQPLSGALIAENYDGDERSKVMGQQTSAQMLGCAVMVFVGGYLADIGWNKTFYVHLFAVLSLILVLIYLPNNKPAGRAVTGNSLAGKVKLTAASFGWFVTMFVFFISGQIFSTFISFFIHTQGLGNAAQAGQTITFFAIGGFIMGLIFGKLVKVTKNLALSIGFLILGASYLIMVYSPNINIVYLGSFIAGLAFSIVMPCIIVGTSESVDRFSVPMAIAIVMCCQNFSMFLSPSIATPIAKIMGGDINKSAMLLGALIVIVMGVIAAFWGVAKNRRAAALIMQKMNG